MAIEIRPSGEAQAVAQAGRVVGAGERAKEERARAEREQQRALEMQARDAARAWELQKLILNSQQDFAHEQRMRQAQLDAEARAREWEVEKMELASRFDFEQDEKKRLRRKATLDSGMESINNSDAPEKEKEIARFTLKSKYMDVEGYEDVLGIKPFYKETKPKEPSFYEKKVAQEFLQEVEEAKPNWLKRILPKSWEGGPSEEQLKLAEQAKEILGQGTISSGLPNPKTKEEYDKIPSGSQYIDSTGNIRVKS